MGSIRRIIIILLLLAGATGTAAAQDQPAATPEATEPISVTSEPGATLAATTTPAASATPEPVVVGDYRFGVIESFEDPAAAGRLGAAWTRARFQWAEVQPDGPGDWQPPLDDEALAAERDAGREVVGLLIGIPRWARTRDGLPRGLSLPADDPDNTWAVFVGEVIGRYAGRIDHWIIWNEPDISDPDAPGHTWDGDIEQFVQLQRTAYLAAKAANADAVVHLGAVTYFWDPGYFDRLLDLLVADPEAADHNHYFDAATAHLYFQPNAVFNVLYAFREVMADHGLDQPIWLVETNAPPMNDPYWDVPNWTLAVTLNEQAAFVPQALAAALAAGAERVAVYKLKDTEDDHAANPEPFGLMRWDDSRRPAFDTYRVAIRLLGGVAAAERERWDAVAQVRLEQDGRTTTVLFARLPESQTARVPATAATADLIDMWGKREEIEARGGFFTVELPGALCLQTIADYCMIGGTTYYLVQKVDEAFIAGATVEADEATPAATPVRTGPAATARPTRIAATATATASATSPLTATQVNTPAIAATATTRPSPSPTAAAVAIAPAPATPPAESDDMPAAGAPAAMWTDYSGLIIIGLGLLLAAALAGWRYARRRDA